MWQKMFQVGSGGGTPAQLIIHNYDGSTFPTTEKTQTYTAERSGVLHFNYGNRSSGASELKINGTAKTPIVSFGNASRYCFIGYYEETINKGDVITVTQTSSGGTTITNFGCIADE